MKKTGDYDEPNFIFMRKSVTDIKTRKSEGKETKHYKDEQHGPHKKSGMNSCAGEW